MRSYSVCKLVPPTVLSVRIVPKFRTTVYMLNIIVGCLSPAFRKIIRLEKTLYEWFFPGSGSPRDHHRSVHIVQCCVIFCILCYWIWCMTLNEKRCCTCVHKNVTKLAQHAEECRKCWKCCIIEKRLYVNTKFMWTSYCSPPNWKIDCPQSLKWLEAKHINELWKRLSRSSWPKNP